MCYCRGARLIRYAMWINPTPRMSYYLVAKGVLRKQPFFLVDVGASGGIAPHWMDFGDSLRAVGFDPLVREVERLNAAERNPAVQYVPALVGCRDMAKLIPDGVFSADPHFRTSSVRAQERLNLNYTRTYFDQTHDGAVTSDLIELDEYFEQKASDVDFIKVDTDTADMAVLLGARKLLSGAGPIALALETHLVGCAYQYANVLTNVGTYLQELGYSLFTIDPKSYTRAALPKLFRWPKPADTFAGQARWADTLFCRDVCIPGYEKQFGVTLTPHKILKLCCTFELFGLEDCAAEVLVTFADRIRPLVDVEHCLDLLTPPLPDGRIVSYREYLDVFDRNVEAFYPEAGMTDLEAQLRNCELEVANLRRAMQNSVALKLARSLPWLTGPLRSLFQRLP